MGILWDIQPPGVLSPVILGEEARGVSAPTVLNVGHVANPVSIPGRKRSVGLVGSLSTLESWRLPSSVQHYLTAFRRFSGLSARISKKNVDTSEAIFNVLSDT